MSAEKRPDKKTRLHLRNKNRERYNLEALTKAMPELAAFVKPNKHGQASVDFANPIAVKTLNKALLNHYYGIKYWNFPDKNLCPPIPGRADYIHHIADVLAENNFGTIPTGKTITCFDIGVGANCIYPILGVVEYDWNFIGSDIDPKSIEVAKNIVANNEQLKNKVDCRLQPNPRDLFFGVIARDEKVDLAICNPPFHASVDDALKGTQRKVKNLSGKKEKQPTLNFAGVSHELVCDGGESKFIKNLLYESKKYAKNCFWFSTLVSKQSNLKGIYKTLDLLEANQVKTINMGIGNKSSRIVAWNFLSELDKKTWRETRWKK